MTQGPSLALTTFQGSVPFLEPLPRDPCLIAFPSFLPDYLWVFLTVLVIQTLSASFQLVFNENCSIFRSALQPPVLCEVTSVVSDSLRPHLGPAVTRVQPPAFPRHSRGTRDT